MPKSLQIMGNSAYGGGVFVLLEWCKHLLRHKWSVDLVATHPSVVAKAKRIPGIGIINEILIPREIQLLEDMRAFGQLVRLIRRQRYDVVHTYTATPAFIGRIAARLAGARIVLNHQAAWTVDESTPFLKRLAFTALEYVAALASTRGICVSQAVARQARRLHTAPQRRLVTICNGIQAEPFIKAACEGAGAALRGRLAIDPDQIVIGNTSRLSVDKDNETLIRALAELRSLMPSLPLALVLAGVGSELERHQELARRLGLSSQVFFLGFCEEIPEFLDAVDIFVSPSLREGLSISLLEAMASAKPIVATSIEPNLELIAHESTGLLVPLRAPAEMAQAVKRLIDHPDLARQYGQAARERVLERYTIDRMLEETMQLYEQLMGAQ